MEAFVKTIRFRPIRACVALAISAASVALSAQTGPAAGIQGTWVVIAQDGRDVPPALHVGLVIAANKYKGVEGGKVTESGTVTFDDTIAAVLVRGQRLTLIIPSIGGGIDGTLTDGQIGSTFSQAGATLQLILKKLD